MHFGMKTIYTYLTGDLSDDLMMDLARHSDGSLDESTWDRLCEARKTILDRAWAVQRQHEDGAQTQASKDWDRGFSAKYDE
jgi:hypothetical protein